MAEYGYPTSAELREIEQTLLPRLEADRPIFNILPTREVDQHLVMWEQQDNYVGLQQVRGLNGQPPKVARIGLRRFQLQPGVYGEHIPIDEQELTTRRERGTFGTPISIDDLVMDIQRQLLQRRLDRQEQIGWTLLSTGTFSVAGPSGSILHTDTFSVQTFTAGVLWSVPATSTPLNDFRAVQLLARGVSVRFDQAATAYMNRVTANRLLTNTNAADFGGKRTSGLEPVNTLAQINMLLTGEGLPNIAVYDQGYLNDAGTFVPFIADGLVVVVGARTDGAPLGAYQMTRNANNPANAPGAYTRVIDKGEQEIPRSIEVHDGHNGGPIIEFPSGIVRMNV